MIIRCNVCRKLARLLVKLNGLEYPYCQSCFDDCKAIIEKVPYTIEILESQQPITKHELIHQQLAELEKQSRGKKPLSTEERDHQEQLRIIRGIKKHFNKPPS